MNIFRRALPIAAVVLTGLMGCRSIARPQVLFDADQLAEAPALADAKRDAASAFAKAEALRQQAHAAFDDGRHADAQFLGEQALAAYHHARELARHIRAEAELARVTKARDDVSSELDDIDQRQARASADVAALEEQLRVIDDAELVSSSQPGGPEREKARMEAARAMFRQAQLLCLAAAMVDAPSTTKVLGAPSSEEVTQKLQAAQTKLDDIQKALTDGKIAPIDQAARARADCLSVLTLRRRGNTPVSTAPGAGDELLSQLSEGGYAPTRDDRGIAVTVRSAFKGAALTAAADKTLTDLGAVARANPSFPLLVVLHTSTAAATTAGQSRLMTATSKLKDARGAGDKGISGLVAGADLPIVSTTGKQKQQNERLEIVFVVPETF